MRRAPTFAAIALLLVPVATVADSHVESEVIQTIEESFAHSREKGISPPDETAADGSLEFWSSGGLMNWTDPADPPGEWESFNLRPKHIKVIPIGADAAVAMYYSEGSMQPKGSARVPHYLTRVTELWLKEDGKWRRRAAHWSAVTGGSGTSQSTPTEDE